MRRPVSLVPVVHALLLVATFFLVSEPGALALTGGTQLWVSSFDPRALGGGIEALSPDGSKVFVVGTGQAVGEVQTSYALIVAYGASAGKVLWATRGPKRFSPASLSVRPDGSTVFVTGFIGGASYATFFLTVAYDASTGARLWTRRYGSSKSLESVASSLSVSPNGSRVIVTGYTVLVCTPSPCYGSYSETIAYRASTGQTLWTARRQGSSTAIAVSPNGSRVFVSGTGFSTVAYRASTGNTLWVSRNHDPSLTDPRAIAMSPDGSELFVTGLGGSIGESYATVAYDTSSGARLWVRSGNPQGIAESVAVSPDGSTVFVTGTSEGTTDVYHWATLAYDAFNGKTLWLRRYSDWANLEDIVSSVAVSPDGSKVFVAGTKLGTDHVQFQTITYEASTGRRVWDKGYNCPGAGESGYASVSSVAVSPDGSKVFVSGVCWRYYEAPRAGGLTVVAYAT
jgi:WD40 repeat protein